MTVLEVMLPPKPKLEPLPDRFLRLSVNVVLDGQRRTIEYVWKCTNEKGISAAVGWYLRWQAEGEPRHYVVKEIADNLVVFFRQPPSNYCLIKGQVPYTPDVGVIPDPPKLDRVIVYRARGFHRSSAILGGTIERLDHDPKVAGPSLDDENLANLLRTYQGDLVAAEVTITPESTWGRYPKLKSYFGKMTTVTRAPLPSPPRHSYGFPILGEVRRDADDSFKSLYYSVQDINGTITFDPSRAPEYREVFRLDRRDHRRKVTFCYAGRCVPLRGQSDDFYFPETRSIVNVFHSIVLKNNMY